MEIEGDHSASPTSQGPSLDANESLASLSPPPFLHDSLDVFDLPPASHLVDFDTPASPGPSSMHMSTSSESCSVSCYDIGLLLKSTPQSHVATWFVYSKEEDGLFCLPCVLFASKEMLGQLVTEKFNHWTKKTSKFSNHNSINWLSLRLKL